MFIEEFDLFFECDLDGDSIIDIFLSSVDDTDVPQFEMDLLIHQHLLSGGALIHDVDFGDDSDGPLLASIPLSGQFQTVGDCHVLIGRDYTEDNGFGIFAVPGCHIGGDLLDVFLTLDVDPGDARQVDHGQVGAIVGVDSEFDGVVHDISSLSG